VGENAVAEEIRALLAAREPIDLASIERTLTDGYARALALEGERWRIAKRIAELAAAVGADDGSERTELASLAQRLEVSDDDLAMLRALLASLRERAHEIRAA
jgi:hypothetical protein